MRLLFSIIVVLVLSPLAQAKPMMEAMAEQKDSDIVIIDTNMGSMTVQLNSQKAPKTVENFKSYVKESYYDGVVFHRVIKDFMIQGGGFTENLSKKSAPRTVVNESKNGLSNILGSISMARTNDPHSGSSQFFINHKDNAFLDGNENKFGYTVFGQVTEGLEVLDAIAKVKTTSKRGMRDWPVENVIIKSIRFKQKPDQVEELKDKLLKK